MTTPSAFWASNHRSALRKCAPSSIVGTCMSLRTPSLSRHGLSAATPLSGFIAAANAPANAMPPNERLVTMTGLLATSRPPRSSRIPE